MNWEEQLQRQWEVNIFNNLGFLCNGYSVEETDRGWKGETREATSIEVDFWNRFEQTTPEIPVIQISDDVDLCGCSLDIPFEDFEDQAIEQRLMWLENKYEKALCAKTEDVSWRVRYINHKEFRIT